ncbi:MAG: ribonuclease HII [Candidatus Liptonbacteria bacterium]|nr:ribonuclease HII [Candidatus Liptonbacteria bacterium]
MKRNPQKYIIGIDEVGRGALAGPVVVAAVCFPAGMKISNRKLGALKDSKNLSPKLRKLWTEYFKSISEISHKTARIYPRTIEKINISEAANRSASVAFGRLIAELKIGVRNCSIFLDGGLFIKPAPARAKTIIKGDEKITAIKIASIIAKVQRDRYMEKLSKKYPHYGFEAHKGYGTKRHLKAIRRHGPNEAHRLTFLTFSSESARKA